MADKGKREVWLTAGVPRVVHIEEQATWAEASGFDGVSYADTQNVTCDVYASIALAARATSRVGLAIGVTNPFTRHAAVTASAAATVQELSGGRVVLGIGRGDSALAQIGLAPTTVAEFEAYVRAVQRYLRGEEIPFDEIPRSPNARPIDILELAPANEGSKLRWLRDDVAKVPLNIAASGPKVINVGAAHAERISFMLTADAARIAWAVERAKAAAEECGRDPQEVSFGAYITVVVDDDRDRARKLAARSLPATSRISVMHGTPHGLAQPGIDVFAEVRKSYGRALRRNDHDADRPVLSDDFVDYASIAGPSEECIDRMRGLFDVGLDRLEVLGPPFGQDGSAESWALFVEEVIPKVRGTSVASSTAR